jgi:cell division protein FtsN
MADYKHRAGSKKKSRNGGSCTVWFFGGLVVGVFIVGLLWLKMSSNLGGAAVPGVTKPKVSAAKPERDTPKPTFEFYTILPEMEVVIPDEELVAPESTDAPSTHVAPTTTSVQDGTSYILQMGSFRKFEDADRTKAKLALIGIEAEIQKVSINNRDTFHRVRSGPYKTQAELNAVRKLAKDNNIASLVIKLKP